jgi:hypothetical protein
MLGLLEQILQKERTAMAAIDDLTAAVTGLTDAVALAASVK